MKSHAFAEFRLWQGIAPLSEKTDAEIREKILESDDGIERITNVAVPALSYFPASGRGPHPAVLICPGGGYEILAWNHEGRDIAGWLNSNGISAFLLKYRCPGRRNAALADAVRAMRLIRSNPEEFSLMPDKIGIIGFSAGAHLAARVCNPADHAVYEPSDAVDSRDPRPDFAMMIYPAYIFREGWGTDPDLAVTEHTPRTFIMQAENDEPHVNSALAYYIALKQAGVPAEMHLFSHGGHGYGLFRNGNATQAWPELAMRWFGTDVMQSCRWQDK